MNFLQFLDNKTKIESGKEYLYEAFKNDDFNRALQLIQSLLRKKVDGQLAFFKHSSETKIDNINCISHTLVHTWDNGKSGNVAGEVVMFNFKVNDKNKEVYSVAFFKDTKFLFTGKGKADLVIDTMGTSIALILPAVIELMNSHGNYNMSQTNAKKLASNIFKGATTNEHYIGAVKYNLFEGLSRQTLDDIFMLEASEAQNYRWQKKAERDEAYKNRKNDPMTYERIQKEYQEILSAVRGGATTIDEINIAIKKNVTVVADNEEIKEQEAEFKKLMEDPEEAFKQMAVYIKSVIKGVQPGTIICGAPGIGKTYRVKQQLKAAGYHEGHNLYTIKGTESVRQLYIDMYNNKEKGKIILIDDADALVGPKASEVAINILKAALDSTADDEGRLVSYKVSGDLKDEEGIVIPKRMYYNGGVIVLTNYGVGELNKALKGRVFTQSIDFTTEQLLKIIENIMPAIMPQLLSKEAKQKAYDYLIKLSEQKIDMQISIRSFCACAKLYEVVDGENMSETSIEYMIKEQMMNQALTGGKSFN